MPDLAELPPDQLAANAPQGTQRLAARMAQDAFARIFRLTLDSDAKTLTDALKEIESASYNWCQAGGKSNGSALRFAMLISGIDQWGLAYSQAFGLNSIPGITALLGAIRNRLSPEEEALFQNFFSQIASTETDAVDFKIELRRSIHLALWHAMAACESEDESRKIMQSLGGLMVALDQKMPHIGWRLLADSLASIQISLLSNPAESSAQAQKSTEELFESLRHALRKEQFQAILAYSGQAVLAWQQSRRPAN